MTAVGPSGSGSASPPCPVCEHPSAKPLWRLGDRLFRAVPGEFTLYECPGCRLLFQDPQIPVSELGNFYPPGYWWRAGRGWLSGLQEIYRREVVRRDHLRFVRSIWPDPAGVRLLDVGTGSGLFVQLATAAGYDAYGLEASPEAVEEARPHLSHRIILGSETSAAESAGPFDVVTLFHALEHIPDPFHFLRNVQKLLRHPGHLVVQVPNRSSWQAACFGRRWYGLDCPRHLNNFSLYSLLFVLGRAGFRIRQVRHFSLRDNAAALVSSLFPGLDPIVRRVRRQGRPPAGLGEVLASGVYFGAVVLAQPLAWIEARAGHGATVMVWASWDV